MGVGTTDLIGNEVNVAPQEPPSMFGPLMRDLPTEPGGSPLRGFRYKHGDRPLDGYTIQRAAGRGGFGEVYYAISDGGREVALKVVQAYEQIELRGISQCMNLKSPHLVTIFDVRFGAEGQPFVIMEYVNGPSLRELLDQSPSGLGTQKAAFFLREIGKGLTYLHDCGIVHRDLKPGNIFYENGAVKIGDYGLSKAITASHRSGQTVTVGTVHYMAPEIGAGKYDRGIDIYAMGALLYEMLTGQVPFFGASPAEVLMKHLTVAPPLDGIEEPFATVIRRAMAKDPAQRYQSVQEMVEAVFGAEHVRQSVSCFSPESLSIVAGRAAREAGIEGSFKPSTVAPEQGGRGEEAATWFDRMGQRFAAVGNRMANVGAQVGQRVVCKWRRKGPAAVPVAEVAKPHAAVAVSAASDPLPGKQRFFLMIMATAVVAIGAGVMNPNMREPAISAFFVFFGATGAGFGIRWAARHWLPALRSESWLLRHVAIGSPGLVVGLILAMMIAGPNEWEFRNSNVSLGATVGAICIALLVVDWGKRTDARRAERMSLGEIIYAGVAGLVTATMFGGDVMLVVGVLAATCMAVQVGSPWIGMRRRPAPASALSPVMRGLNSSMPDASPQVARPVEPVVPGVAVPPPPPPPTSYAGAAVSMSSAVGSVREVGPSIIGRFFRFIFAVVASVFLIGAVAGALALAYDIPGVIAAGGFGPEPARDLTRAFGTSGWPSIMRAMIGAEMFVAALVAAVIFLLLRRSWGGGIHMLRAVAGIFLVLWAPFVLFTGVPTLRIEGPPTPGGWTVTELYLKQIRPEFAVRAAIVLLSGVMMLMWPARAKKSKSGSSPAAPSPA
jgi:hypothetical protein